MRPLLRLVRTSKTLRFSILMRRGNSWVFTPTQMQQISKILQVNRSIVGGSAAAISRQDLVQEASSSLQMMVIAQTSWVPGILKTRIKPQCRETLIVIPGAGILPAKRTREHLSWMAGISTSPVVQAVQFLSPTHT